MDPPTALSCMLLEPFDTSLQFRRTKISDNWKWHKKWNAELKIPTQEPGRFLPTESCALVVHSLQVSVCTAEYRGPLGFPGLTIIFNKYFYPLSKSLDDMISDRPLTKAISRVLLPISLSTWWSSRLSCSLEITAELTPPAGHLGCCWAATAWFWQGCTGCPANALASLCIIKELLAACHTREDAKRLSTLWNFLALIKRSKCKFS